MKSVSDLKVLPEYVPGSTMSASAADRWINCTASVAGAINEDQIGPTFWAAEGTVAHHVLEECVRTGDDPWEYLGEQFLHGDTIIEVNAEMVDVLQECVDHLRLMSTGGSQEPLQEVRLRLAGTDVTGTSDFIRPEVRPVYVADLKYGFMPVSPKARQTGLYGLMVIGPDAVQEGDEAEVLVISDIMQPRTWGRVVQRHEWTRKALKKLLDEIHEAIERVRLKDFTYSHGPWCQFCPRVPTCPHLSLMAKDSILGQVVRNPDTDLTPEKLDEIAERLPVMKLFFRRSSELIERYLKAGGHLDHAKLVKKKSNRVWKDEKAAEAKLRELGVEPYERKLISPADAEKKLPSARKKEIEGLARKPPAGLTMAPMTDPRPAQKPIGVDADVDREAARKSARLLIEKAKTGTQS